MRRMTSTSHREWFNFLRGFLRAPRTVGSIAPSSTHLVTAMLDEAAIEQRRVIAELGPGTGVFTMQIIRRMPPDARLFVFEVDAYFVDKLREAIADPRVTIIHGSAEDLRNYLRADGLDQVDCVISGLPFTSLPREVTHAILQVVRATLQPGGLFVTYQYTPMLLRVFRSYFQSARVARFVPRNLPPALVLVCAAQ